MHFNPCVTIYHWKAFLPMCCLSCLQFPALYVDSFKKKLWLSRAIMRHLKSFNCDFATLLSSPLIAPVSSPDRSGCGLLWWHCTYKKHLNSTSNRTNHLSTLQIWKGPNPLKSRWSIHSLYFLLMCVCRVSLSDFCNVSLISFQLNEAAKRLTIGDSSSDSSRTNSPGGVWLN